MPPATIPPSEGTSGAATRASRRPPPANGLACRFLQLLLPAGALFFTDGLGQKPSDPDTLQHPRSEPQEDKIGREHDGDRGRGLERRDPAADERDRDERDRHTDGAVQDERWSLQRHLPCDQRTQAEHAGEVDQVRTENDAVAGVVGARDECGYTGSDLRAVRAKSHQQPDVAGPRVQPLPEPLDAAWKPSAARQHQHQTADELENREDHVEILITSGGASFSASSLADR